MKRILKCLSISLSVLFFISCKQEVIQKEPELIMAFGSCNKQYLKNDLWDDIIAQDPDVWIWGGDIVYADTKNMDTLREDYNKLLQDEAIKS